MKFDDLDARLRIFETAHDHCALPGLYLVARLDGRGFTRLTKEVHQFEAPFDERMRDYMTATTRHLLDCGFRMVYGYTQSDEISLLLHPDEASFGRKLRKYISVLAGEASATFSLQLGAPGVLDCHLLFGHGTNYNDLPAWQKRGVGLYWEDYQKSGFNPHTQTTVETTRRRLTINPELPLGPAYETFIQALLPTPAA